MSNYHVLDASNDGGSIRVAFHVPVPVQNNVAGRTLISCITEDSGYDKTSKVPNITTAEQDALTSGTLIEKIINFRTNKGVPNATKQARLDARYLSAVAEVQEDIIQRYWASGFERTI